MLRSPSFLLVLLTLLLFDHWVSAYLNVGDVLWEDSFDDENNGLKTEYWNYVLGDGCDFNNCGWGNDELQYYTADSVSVSSGNLGLTARRREEGNSRFTSGRITTQDKVMVQYGRIEARIRIPDVVEGLWPAFWTLGEYLLLHVVLMLLFSFILVLLVSGFLGLTNRA